MRMPNGIHILTGEYPPQAGGVSDYSALLATALAARSTRVHVWAPGRSGTTRENGVVVHRTGGRFSPGDLADLDRAINLAPAPRRLLVQWTPHSFGYRSLNLFLPFWLLTRAKIHGDRVELMIHEPFLAFREGGIKQTIAAATQRPMIATLLAAASQVWTSIPAWEPLLRPWCFGRSIEFRWLPVPSNCPTHTDPDRVQQLRAALTPPGRALIGHFGSFRPDIASLLAPAVKQVLHQSHASMLLAGSGSTAFRNALCAAYPELRDRFLATGPLPAAAIAQHLAACDILLQPYPDGISTRRGTAMAALALGCPMVTNLGRLSEPFWPTSHAALFARSFQPADLTEAAHTLLTGPALRRQLADSARHLYADRFDLTHTVNALLQAPVPCRSSAAA